MKNQNSALIHVKVQKKSDESVDSDALDDKSTKISDAKQQRYTYTDRFNFYCQPWTIQFLCKLYLWGWRPAQREIPLAPQKQYAEVYAEAKIYAEALVGIQHRQVNINLPCQDAVKAALRPRPILVLCDGAGSASVSDLGSSALVIQLTRLCQSMEPMIAQYLDDTDAQDFTPLVRVIIRHAKGILQDLADMHRRAIADFRSTLNFAVAGTQHILWIKVGDGEIVQEKIYQRGEHSPEPEYECLGSQNKGEFANQTQFIDERLTMEDVQWGVLDSHTTTGLVLMSDGSAEKLVSIQRHQIAGQLTQWIQQLRLDQLKVADVYKRFYSEEFLSRSTGDDRSIAIYSRKYHFI